MVCWTGARRRALGMLLVCMIALGTAPSAFAADSAKPAVDKRIDPTHSGKAVGYVYDASTGQPVVGAVVSIRKDGVFAEKGGGSTKTEESGRYRCDALIGRKSESVNALGVLSVALIGGSPFSTGDRTYRIDVTRLPIRVTCEGYRPFEGIVTCRSRYAEGFGVSMQPILLTPTARNEASTTADTWGNTGLVSVTLDKPVAAPKEKVTLTAEVKVPRARKASEVKVACSSALWNSKDLKPVKTDDEGAATVKYIVSFDAPKAAELQVIPIRVHVYQCPYDLFPGGESRIVVLQTGANPDGSQASARAEATSMRQAGNNSGAQEILKQLCSRDDAVFDDLLALAYVSDAIHDYDTAARSWERALALCPKEGRLLLMGAHARSLVSSGQGEAALAKYQPVIDAVKPENRPKTVPLNMMVALGNAHLAQGRLDDAELVSQYLMLWSDANEDSDATAFRYSLREAEAQAKVSQAPTDPVAWAEYGRALLDQRRWEEAVSKLNKSLELGPDQPAVRSDLNYALLHITGRTLDTKSLDESIASARSATVTVKDKKEQKSKDFFTWHTLGMLLYEKYRALRAQDQGEHTEALQECMDAFTEALVCSRAGKDTRQERYWSAGGGFSSSVVGIEGFAYAEADSDFLLMQSLKSLAVRPDDYLDLFNLSDALLSLGRADLAQDAIGRCMSAKPDFIDGKYMAALIARGAGDSGRARTLLDEVLTANPRHPRANMVCAEMCTEEGDTIGAATYLANHAAFYGSRQ